jgi:hypothetical protein
MAQMVVVGAFDSEMVQFLYERIISDFLRLIGREIA